MTNKKVRSGLRLSTELNSQLAEIARQMGVTKNQLMVHILWEWAKENGKAS